MPFAENKAIGYGGTTYPSDYNLTIPVGFPTQHPKVLSSHKDRQQGKVGIDLGQSDAELTWTLAELRTPRTILHSRYCTRDLRVVLYTFCKSFVLSTCSVSGIMLADGPSMGGSMVHQ